jgi:hypothetical protein
MIKNEFIFFLVFFDFGIDRFFGSGSILYILIIGLPENLKGRGADPALI